MCRAITLFVALAAFLSATAFGATTSNAKSHRKAPGSQTHRRSSVAESVHRAPRSREATSRPAKASAQEVGHAAGLRIRRQIEERRTVYRRRVLRESRYRRPRLIETRVVRYPARSIQPPIPADDPHPQLAMATPAEQSYANAPIEAVQSPNPGQPAGPSNSHALSAAETEAASGLADEPAVSVAGAEVASLTIPHGAMPAPLKGSLESLTRQNDRLAAEGLERIENEDDLASRIANHLLVPVPESNALSVNPALPPNHRYCRPWTAQFVADLARDHDAVFHRPIEVSSAVRTVEYQQRLMRINGNAAPAEGDVVSPHLTGATIDIAKQGLTRSEMKWMRHRLLQLQDEGKIDVEEEFHQSCFHITVYKDYVPGSPIRRAAHPQPEENAPSAPAATDLGATEGL
jgi:hypothetical protein